MLTQMPQSTKPIALKPREKLVNNGADSLTVPELITILIGSGNSTYSAEQIAQELVDHFPLDLLAHRPMVELLAIKGAGMAAVCRILAGIELGRRIFDDNHSRLVTDPGQVVKLFPFLQTAKQEHLLGIYLDSRGQMIDSSTLAIGSVSNISITPREVFEPVLSTHASSIILVHNHPSGSPEPSRQDIQFTDQIKAGAELLQIELIDHIIIGKRDYVSLRGMGLL